MQTQNGQNVVQEVILIRIAYDARYVSRVEELLTPNQIIFLDNLRNHGKNALIESLRCAHDSIAYSSDIEISKEFKDVLFDLKQLGDWLERI